MTYLYLAAKFWRECIIVLLAFLLLICLIIQNHQAAEIKDQKKLHADYVAAQQLSIAKANADAAIQEKIWAEKITKAEQNYNVKIKQIQSDAIAAQSSANSLSKQLANAKQRLSTASREASNEYCATLGNVFERSIEEYTKMARYADEHRVNEEKLSDAWPSD
ncbi:hypothetical protein [Acinetobacter guerrae]|uniref:hypothetical protein n=1 Tax=Acinetobacter guerrae TaxID=1843371 RepID=UPI00128D9A3F|nr:hypothetical protein [Acinetobacter guerrae]MPW43386.1 hypothetical protein [Acinetobacter guerrae]